MFLRGDSSTLRASGDAATAASLPTEGVGENPAPRSIVRASAARLPLYAAPASAAPPLLVAALAGAMVVLLLIAKLGGLR